MDVALWGEWRCVCAASAAGCFACVLRLRCVCVASALTVASALLEEKKRAYVHLSLVYGVSRDFLRQSEPTRPYPGAPVRKNENRRSEHDHANPQRELQA